MKNKDIELTNPELTDFSKITEVIRKTSNPGVKEAISAFTAMVAQDQSS